MSENSNFLWSATIGHFFFWLFAYAHVSCPEVAEKWIDCSYCIYLPDSTRPDQLLILLIYV